ncbi:MAG TPA: cation transporter [Pyrinomonadaceae bacterium]|jgi:divalent metal cation (Fe/Co/Zn/Cd) transporter
MKQEVILLSKSDRAALIRRGQMLEYFTIGWNLLEGVVAVGSGIIAGSPSLVGFGIDSFIESTSGAALLWRLRVDDEETRERREQIALRLVGASFLLLAGYVAYDSITTLVWRELPETSYIGIALLVISLIVMPVLARAKRRVAVEIKSRALEADSKQTDLCVYLSAISLGGLALNAAFGWWWADPVAALIMVPIIVNEGIEGLRGETCCDDSCH